MSVGFIPCKWSPFAAEGRIIGSFVYMLLCRDEQRIYIKVGRSIQPEKRFLALKNGCPVTPRTFSVIHVPGNAIAKRLERDLHDAFSKWRVAGEWFAMTMEDKRDFNDALRAVLTANSMPSWPLQIVKVPAATLIKIAEKRSAYWRSKYKKGGKAFRDFLKHSA